MPSPLAGKRVHLDPSVKDRPLTSRWVTARGGVLADVDAALDYLVLAESRRATPGKSTAERKAAKVPPGRIATLYEADLPPLLLPTPEEVLAFLRSGNATEKAWDALLPPYNSPWLIDISGADLSGLDLANLWLRNLVLDGVVLRDTNLDQGSVKSPRDVDFRVLRQPARLFVGQPERCDFRDMDLHGISVTRSVGCDLTGTTSAGEKLGSWAATDLTAERADFSRCEAKRMAVPAARLRAARFADAGLSEANFEGADLREADFGGANLRAASFQKANLGKASFHNANLARADFTGAKVTGADFTGSNLVGAFGLPATVVKKTTPGTALLRLVAALDELAKWRLGFVLDLHPGQVRITWERTKTIIAEAGSGEGSSWSSSVGDVLEGIRAKRGIYATATVALASVRVHPPEAAAALASLPLLALAEAFGQPFTSAAEAEAALARAVAEAAERRSEILQSLRSGVDLWNVLPRVERDGTDLGGVDLSGCSLAGVNLGHAECVRINLAGTDLSRAHLSSANLARANLRGADLHRAFLRCGKLPETDLEAADLREADLMYANLRKANLRNADLTGATLHMANLAGADLTGATVAGTIFTRAAYDAATTFPAGFDPVATGMKVKGAAKKKAAATTTPTADAEAFAAFHRRVIEQTDHRRVGQAVAMLKAEKFQLFSEVTDAHLIGVVRSPSSKERFYACRLTAKGEYECGTQRLNRCAALGAGICKHTLVLILGLTRGGAIDPETALAWMKLTKGKSPTFEKDALTATFLKYKGVADGTVDWRPTETVPEDYYAL